MSNYKELIQNIFAPYQQTKIQALRKLIYLAVNDQNKFSQYVAKISQRIPHFFVDHEDQQVKLLSLQLLSEMATNFTAKIPAEYYDFPLLIALLSDQNPQVRKSAHYLILIFIKKYEHFDEVIQGYLQRLKKSPDHWKVVQKIIHSFQSLLVIQPKCVSYGSDYSKLDNFLNFLLKNRDHSHSLVQKASEQTVSSFVKNEYVPEILPKLDSKIIQQLVEHASKLSINLPLPSSLKHKKKIEEEDDIEEIKITRKRNLSVLEQLINKLDQENDWKIKSETIEAINNEICKGNADFPEQLVQKVLDLTYDYNFKTCITAMNGLLNLVTLYPAKIASRHRQIEDVVVDKVCDLKMAVRQLANKILRKIYPNHSKDFLKRLMNKLSHCSVVGKQQILNFLQQVFTTNIPTELQFLLTQVSNQLLNQNTRIKIKAIDCLVRISMANDLEECKGILAKKLNKVYFDMFIQRLKEKTGTDKGNDRWDDRPNINKGMTWQAERTNMMVESDKQALTKVQFGNKRNFNQTEDDFVQFDTKKEKEKNLNATSVNSHKTTNTLNTFDTFKSYDEPKTKKLTDQGQGGSFTSYQLQRQQLEKKIPMKPNPVKKKNQFETKEQSSGLVIQSRQYMNKNNLDQIKEQKEKEKQKPKIKQLKVPKEKQESEIKRQKTPNEPFSIKKSGSKKQHALDYKATQYISKDQLAPVDNTKDTLKYIITNLPKDNDWSKQFDSLDGLRRLIKNHHEFYPTIVQNLQGIMPQVLKLVESLRSSVAKNAMITLAQMCEAFKKSMDPFLQGIFIKLFKKTQDANSFIVQEVRKCTVSLCTYCSASKIIPIIVSNSNAKAAPVKLKVALCIDKILQKSNYSNQLLKENPKLVGVMSNFIVDSSAEVRGMVKQVFIELGTNNPISQIQGMFKKGSSRDSWEKWNLIIDRQIETEKRKKF